MHDKDNEFQFRGTTVILLAGILLGGLLLRIANLEAEVPWYDEVTLVQEVEAQSLTDFLWSIRDSNPAVPPLYPSMLYFWTKSVGLSDSLVLNMRLFSVSLSILALFLLYFLARELVGNQAALIATALFAVSPWQIYFAQEIRPYALVIPFAMLSCLAFVKVLHIRNKRWLFLNAFANSLLVFTHPFSGLLFVVQAAILVLFHRKPGKFIVGQERTLVAWVVLHSLTSVGLLFWVTTLDFVKIAAIDWPKPTLVWVLRYFFRSIGKSFTGPTGMLAETLSPLRLFFDLVLAGLFFYALYRCVQWMVRESRVQGRIPAQERLTFLLLLLLVPPVTLFVLSYTWKACFVTRYLLFASPAVPILLAGGINSLGRSGRAVALTLLGVTLGFQLLFIYPGPVRGPWDKVSQHIQTNDPGIPVVTLPDHVAISLRYIWDNPNSVSIVPARKTEGMIHNLERLLKHNQSIWVVHGNRHGWTWRFKLSAYLQQNSPSTRYTSTLTNNLESYIEDHNLSFTKTHFRAGSSVVVYNIERESLSPLSSAF